LNVLYTITAYPPSIGGAQLHMHQLAQALSVRHRVHVVTQWDAQRTDWLLGSTLTGPRTPRAYEQDGIRVDRIAVPGRARVMLAPWVAAYPAFQGPAIRHIASALADCARPLVGDADVVHNCRIGREGLTAASLSLARERGLPFVLTPVHHPRWGGFLHRHFHHLYREADAVIALTPAERDTLVALGVDAGRVAVTGIGPIVADDHDAERFRRERSLGSDPIVLFLGQKYPYKGIGPLLEAAPLVWKTVPEARFVFLGPRTRDSRRLFARVSDPRVSESAAVSLQEKTDALAACDVMCLPSSQESFGGAFTEAWALGKPVVGADIPAVRAVVDDGQDGFLVEPAAAPLAARIVRLLTEPALRAQMGASGRDKVVRRYGWPLLAEQTERVYADARERRSGRRP
jgi:glycosyltransferase involved in cell wall biosynthesis